MTHISFDRRSFNRVFLCGVDATFMDMTEMLVPSYASIQHLSPPARKRSAGTRT